MSMNYNTIGVSFVSCSYCLSSMHDTVSPHQGDCEGGEAPSTLSRPKGKHGPQYRDEPQQRPHHARNRLTTSDSDSDHDPRKEKQGAKVSRFISCVRAQDSDQYIDFRSFDDYI